MINWCSLQECEDIRNQRYFLNLTNNTYPRQRANFLFDGKTEKAFPFLFQTGTRQEA